jgi:hypothetical protein
VWIGYTPGTTYAYSEVAVSPTFGGESAGIDIHISEVPAPAALGLLGISMAGLGLIRRRKSV